jgi:hypothetical protein
VVIDVGSEEILEVTPQTPLTYEEGARLFLVFVSGPNKTKELVPGSLVDEVRAVATIKKHYVL